MHAPPGFKFERQWLNYCCKVHAVAKDLVEGRSGVIATADALCSLAGWLRITDDEDIVVFLQIRRRVVELPTGPERAMWAAHALARADIKISAIEASWSATALKAAQSLMEKYAPALQRRRELRKLQRAAQSSNNRLERSGRSSGEEQGGSND